MYKSAQLSVDGHHRLWLTRRWNPSKAAVAFIGLNPSTADHATEDATTRRLTDYAQRWGYGGFVLVNLFTVRQPRPRALFVEGLVRNADGANEAIENAVGWAANTIVCWGANASHPIVAHRVREVLALLRRARVSPLVLATTRDGHPVHPLRQLRSLVPRVADLAAVYDAQP